MLLFWLTPVVYDFRVLPDSLQMIVYSNPVSHFIAAYQDIFYFGIVPETSDILIMVVMSFSSLFFGFLLFVTYKSRFAEEI